MKTRKLGDLSVSALGLGCMGMSFAYGAQPEAESLETLQRAVDLGVTFFDTAEIYGPFANEILLGKAFKGVRDQVVIATKFGFKIEIAEGKSPMAGLDSRPEHVKAVCDASLKRLGTDVIDLFYQHRVDPAVPIEDTVGALADLVKAGKIRGYGLSEAGAATIRRAHAVHPVTAVQTEYSLSSRDPEAQIIPTCAELGIGFVPYSPLGRGLLGGAIGRTEALPDTDYRRNLPRFQGANLDANVGMVEALSRIAAEKGVTVAQLALAWVLHQGEHIVPIPGARKARHLEDNVGAADIALSQADLSRIAEAMPPAAVAGERYPAAGMATVES